MKTQRILLAIALAASVDLARTALADPDVGLDVQTQVQPAETSVDDDTDASREVDVDDAGDASREVDVDDAADDSREIDVDDAGDPSREEDVDEATEESPGSLDGDEGESDEEDEN